MALRLNLGCGAGETGDVRMGYVNVDREGGEGIVQGDLVAFLEALPENSADEIVLRDILEHFNHGIDDMDGVPQYVGSDNKMTSTALIGLSYSRMLPGGNIYIRVPDFTWAMNKYRNRKISYERLIWMIFGGQEDEYDIHKTAWTKDALRRTLETIGFVDIEVRREEPNLVAEARKPK